MSDDNVTDLFPDGVPTVHPPQIADGAYPRRKKDIIRTAKLDRAKARHRILQLVAAGLTYTEIAEQMTVLDAPIGKTENGIKRIVAGAMEKWAEQNSANLSEYRDKKLFELEVLKRALWASAIQGDVDSVKEARQIIKTQAILSGAAAPQKHEHKHEHSLGIEESEIRAMETAWVNAGPAGELPPGEDIVDVELVE